MEKRRDIRIKLSLWFVKLLRDEADQSDIAMTSVIKRRLHESVRKENPTRYQNAWINQDLEDEEEK